MTDQTLSRLDAARVDPPAQPEPEERCGNCEKTGHFEFHNVQNVSLSLCDSDERTDVLDAADAIIRIIQETSKRVGGIRRDGTLPAHFRDDIVVALWETFGHEDCVFEEYEPDPEDEEYAARGGHYRGCRGDNCGC
jgi:hypothetical protein